MMLYFASVANCITRKIEENIRTRISGRHRLETCRRFDKLQRRLQSPGREISLALLMVRNSTELERLHSMGALLADLRLLIVLALDRSLVPSTTHRLRPRFVMSVESGPDTIADVVEKILCGPAARHGDEI